MRHQLRMKRKSSQRVSKKSSGLRLPAPVSTKPIESSEPDHELNEVADVSQPFAVVAIGASAGGLEAITALLSSLPKDSGMAYVVIQHLDPDHASKSAELLE